MIQPLKINKKIDNDDKLAQIIRENIPHNQFTSADDINAMLAKINEMVPAINVSNGGFQGVLEINEKRVDSGFYIPTQSGTYINADNVVVDLSQGINFVTFDGAKWDVAVVPIDMEEFVSNSDLEVEILSKNRFNGRYIKYWINRDGVLLPSENDKTTELISIPNNSQVTFINGYGKKANPRIIWYNSVGKKIGHYSFGVNLFIDHIEGAEFIQVYFSGDTNDSSENSFQINFDSLYPYDTYKEGIASIAGKEVIQPVTGKIESNNFNAVSGEEVFSKNYASKEFVLENVNKIDYDEIYLKNQTRLDLNKLQSNFKDLFNIGTVKETTSFKKTIKIPNRFGKMVKNVIVPITLHKGDKEDNQSHIYLSNCRNDFTDIRFKCNSNLLHHKIVSSGNYSLVPNNLLPYNSVGFQNYSFHQGFDENIYLTMDSNFEFVKIKDSGDVVGVNILGDLFYTEKGKTNILIKSTKESNYTDKKIVFSSAEDVIWTSSNFRCTNEGVIVTGPYQDRFDAKIYISEDNGDTFKLAYSDSVRQHIHVIEIDRAVTPNVIYVSFDGKMSSSTDLLDSAGTFVSYDSGNNFNRLPIPFKTDFGVMSANDGVLIGGGEGAIKDVPTIFKTNDSHTWQTMLDVETMSMRCQRVGKALYMGCASRNGVNCYPKIYRSEDNGDSWEVVSDGEQIISKTNSNGYRYGSQEGLCFNTTAFLTFGNRDYPTSQFPPIQVIEGGNNYQALCYLFIDELPVNGLEIQVENGYLFYPGETNFTQDLYKTVFEAKLNSPLSTLKINNSFYKVEPSLLSFEESIRRFAFTDFNTDFDDQYACYCSKKIETNESFFVKNRFTISFWIRRLDKTSITGHDRFLFGDEKCFIGLRGASIIVKVNDTIIVSDSVFTSMSYRHYNKIDITCDNGEWKFYINGILKSTVTTELKSLSISRVEIFGEINKIPSQSFLSFIKVYDEYLEESDILRLYQGGLIYSI